MDVDRRYLNTQGGPSGYATINLQPGLPKARRLPGARLRAVPAHRQRPLPQRPPAALRPRPQGPGPHELLADEAAQGDQGADEQHRGGAGRRQRRQRQDSALLRGARLLAAAGTRVPVADRGAGGLLRPDDVEREHRRRVRAVGEPRRRLAEEGHRGRARREGEDEGAAGEGDDRDRAERQRRHRLGVERELPARTARLSDPDAAERHSGQRADLQVLPHDRVLRPEAEGRQGGRPQGREPVRLGRRQEGDPGDPRARERRHADDGRGADLPRHAGRRRRSTRRRSASPRTSSQAHRRRSISSASARTRSTSR